VNFQKVTLAVLIALNGCDSSHPNNNSHNISIKSENLNNDVRSIYDKILSNDRPKINELVQKSNDGDKDASKVLGFLLIQGKFISRNVEKGIEELKKSADSDDKEALSILCKVISVKKYKDTYSEEYEKYCNKNIAKNNIKIKEPNDIDIENAKLITKIKNNSWPAHNGLNGKPSGGGSAVAINSEGYFITNRHVVEGCKKINIMYNKMTAPAESLIMGQNADIAIIKVKYNTPAYINLVSQKPDLGEKIFVGGFPISFLVGQEIKITDGLISGIDSKENNFIQISASISSGNSGGPVVNENSTLIGIATGGVAAGKSEGNSIGYGMNFATHSGVISSFLKQNNINFETNQNNLIYSSKQIAEKLKLTSAMVDCYN
jgi:hypothetical protein